MLNFEILFSVRYLFPYKIPKLYFYPIYLSENLFIAQGIKFKTGIDYCNQTSNTSSKVCISGTEIDVFESGSVVKHFSRPL